MIPMMQEIPIQEKRSRLARVVSYLLALIFTIIYALYCSGRVGWFFLLVLLLAPILSIGITMIFRSRIAIHFWTDDTRLEKREKTLVHISLENPIILPTPPILVSLNVGISVEMDQYHHLVNIAPGGKKEIAVQTMGLLSGMSSVSIDQVQIYDYLGLVSFPIVRRGFEPSEDFSKQYIQTIGILPEIVIPEEADFLKNTMQAALGNENDENQIPFAAGSFGGFPGYEYREYAPGDPMNRIHYKLSAGRDQLYVRLDEKTAVSEISLLLQPVSACSVEEGRRSGGEEAFGSFSRCVMADGAAIDHFLGIAAYLLLRDFSVSCFFYRRGNWEKRVLSEESALMQMLEELADYHPFGELEDLTSPLPPENELPGQGSLILCTPVNSFSAKELVETCKKRGFEQVAVFEALTGNVIE